MMKNELHINGVQLLSQSQKSHVLILSDGSNSVLPNFGWKVHEYLIPEQKSFLIELLIKYLS